MQHADCYGVMVSEEIYLALRPRNFNFDSRPIKISPQLTAYVFEESHPPEDVTDTRSEMAPAEENSQNPLEVKIGYCHFRWICSRLNQLDLLAAIIIN